MRVTIEIEGETFEIDLEREAGTTRATCEGETLEAKVERVDATVTLQGRERRVVDFAKDGRARINGRDVDFRVAALEPGTDAAGDHGGLGVRAMMPGRLVRVLAQRGARVQRGEPLVVLEAMKMQNEVQSPAAGTVLEVLAKEGDVVEVGRVLVRLG